MKLIKPAIAGTLESSDIQITIAPNPGQGIQIELESVVKSQFGDAILDTIHQVLQQMDVTEANVRLVDKGALDCVIRARMQCAICRSAQQPYNWAWEDNTP